MKNQIFIVLLGLFFTLSNTSFAAQTNNDKPACCAKNEACCKKKKACCNEAKLKDCCKQNKPCCKTKEACCGEDKACCKEGMACCKEGNKCCEKTNKTGSVNKAEESEAATTAKSCHKASKPSCCKK